MCAVHTRAAGAMRGLLRPLSTVAMPRAMPDLGMPPCDFSPSKYAGPSYEEVLRIRQENLSPALFTYYSRPMLIHQGHMQWLYDHNNQRYLDLFGGIVTVSVGHCHPKVTAAIQHQQSQLCHTTNIYLHPKIHEYARELAKTLPSPLSVVYFVNSGSEANDLALLMARLHTRSNTVVSLRNSYHGMSPQAMALTSMGSFKYESGGTAGVCQVINADPYRGNWGGKYCRDSPVQTNRNCSCNGGHCEAGVKYAADVDDFIAHCVPKGRLAGFFCESIQGIGGTVQFPRNYVKRVFESVRKAGGVCVSDEVQTGFGRTGEHFWGFQMHGVVPDIVTMAKGMGNGAPLGAVVTTPEIASSMKQALHFNTFGGNPVSCVAGLATLEVIQEDQLQRRSAEVGTFFLEQLADLGTEFPGLVGDVRGKGLMIGMELVADAQARTPLPAQQFLGIMDRCRDLGVLLGKGGVYGSVLRIKPPMCIGKEDADFAIRVIRTAFKEHVEKH